MTERTEPTRSKLVELKQWLTVSDAAQYLALVCGEDVTDADVYQLALDGDLKLSFRFVNAAPGLRTSSEAAETEVDLWLEGVWDLSMSGAERHDVERAYQELIGGPEVDMTFAALGERFVESPDGMQVMVQERDGSVPFSKFYAATSLPADGVFVVRTSALEELRRRKFGAPADRDPELQAPTVRELTAAKSSPADALSVTDSALVPPEDLQPFTLATYDLETAGGRRKAVKAFLASCNRTTQERIERHHIWEAAKYTWPRQFQYWLEAAPPPKGTRACDTNIRRILDMTPANFVALLTNQGLI